MEHVSSVDDNHLGENDTHDDNKNRGKEQRK